MIYSNTSYKYFNFNILKKISRTIDCKCLFAAVIESTVYGTVNAASDLDIAVIVNEYSKFEKKKIYFDEMNLDIYVVSLENIKNNKNYYRNKFIFPTCINRSKDYIVNARNSLNYDYPWIILLKCITSPYIWDSGYLKNNFDVINDLIAPLLVCDYYYSRIFGNINGALKHNIVPVIKYMHVLIEIGAMYQIVCKHKIPNTKYDYILNSIIPSEFRDYGQKLLKTYQNVNVIDNIAKYHDISVDVNKPSPMLLNNWELYRWIKKQLYILKDNIAQIKYTDTFDLRYTEWLNQTKLNVSDVF